MKTLAEKFDTKGVSATGHKIIVRARKKFHARLVNAIDPHVILELPRASLIEQVDDITREMLRFNGLDLSENDTHTLAEQVAEDLYHSSQQMVLKSTATN